MALAVLFGAVSWWVGALMAFALAGGCAAMTARDTRDRAAVARYVDRLSDQAQGEPPRAPMVTEPASQEIVSGAARVDRQWRSRFAAAAGERDHLAEVLAALHDPLLEVDSEGVVRRANPAAQRLIGQRLVGRDLAEVMRHPAVLDAVDAVQAGGAARNVEMLQPVPVERVFEVRVKRFEDGPPTVTAAGTGGGPHWAGHAPIARARPQTLITLHDITGIKRSEQMRADFVANASHELRTPLSTLIGFLETLRGPAREDAAARERFLGIMQEQAGRMARLIDDLLSLSRIELEEHTPPTGAVDTVALLHAVIDSLDMRARDRGMSLDLVVTTAATRVVGDEDQLTQVFQNLIVNAIKYAAADTPITVTVSCGEPDGDPAARAAEVAVTIADRGDGIPRNHLSRLTERFYRVDPGRSRAIGGTGLGLAIVKHIINRHRGRLGIESRVGHGSTFTVFLPAAEGGPSDLRPRSQPAENPIGLPAK